LTWRYGFRIEWTSEHRVELIIDVDVEVSATTAIPYFTRTVMAVY